MAAYIKFDGVDGEAQDKDHKDWSDLLSFDQPIHMPSAEAGSRRRRGDVVLEDVVVVKELDKAGPKLAESACLGKVFPKVDIHLTRSLGGDAQVTYYAYELTNVRIVSYHIGGGVESEDLPIEEISLNFEEIKVTYTVTTAKGKKKGTVEYSCKAGKSK